MKKKILIIAGHKSYKKLKNLKKIQNIIKNNNCQFYFKKKLLPRFEELIQILKFKKLFDPEIILGIGGGSVLDLSKLASMISNRSISFSLKKFKNKKKMNLLYLLPTTAGSGSEETHFSVLYKDNKKHSLANLNMYPDKIIYDAGVLKNLEKNKKIPPALDSFCQAIESMFSEKSNALSLKYSKKAIKLFIRNYEDFFTKKFNEKTCKKMLLCSSFSGKSINITKTNIPHAMSYFLTSKFKLAHGLAVFLNFKQYIRLMYNREKNNKKIKARINFLFKVLNIKKIDEFDYLLSRIEKNLKIEIILKKFRKIQQKNKHLVFKNLNNERLKNTIIKITKKDIAEEII